VFSEKRLEFLARFLSDLSKLFFATGVVKQFFGGEFSTAEMLVGVVISIMLFVLAFLIHPK
jgi:hypothetical protein